MDTTEDMLQDMTQSIVREVSPERIFLFGSWASGKAGPDSDIDLLVVESENFGPAKNRWRELQRIRKALREFRIAKDILLYSHDEFEQFQHAINHIAAYVAREGRPLYERH